MDYETRREIKSLMEEVTRIKEEDCPVCHCIQPMVAVEGVVNPDTDKEKWTDLYRCLGCFTLFEKKLIEVAQQLNIKERR